MTTAIQSTATTTININEEDVMTTTNTRTATRHYYATETYCGGIYVRQFDSKADRDTWCAEDSSRYPVTARQAFSAHTSAIIAM